MDWEPLTRSYVARFIREPFCEECYVRIVTDLARLAEEQSAVPQDVLVCFVRDQNGYLELKTQCTIRGEHYDCHALVFDHWDAERPLP